MFDSRGYEVATDTDWLPQGWVVIAGHLPGTSQPAVGPLALLAPLLSLPPARAVPSVSCAQLMVLSDSKKQTVLEYVS